MQDRALDRVVVARLLLSIKSASFDASDMSLVMNCLSCVDYDSTCKDIMIAWLRVVNTLQCSTNP